MHAPAKDLSERRGHSQTVHVIMGPWVLNEDTLTLVICSGTRYVHRSSGPGDADDVVRETASKYDTPMSECRDSVGVYVYDLH